ncbi:unnamed protein product [Microthlaspi erraticum]|uniref:FBD domain-containing protein n=1 Tax=Microthlaspi erraticum TaxID=1685480 RepID=A0A6D2LE28_9BRAS|nr:unnamed protein product [Microthlaspi erraticum]
MESKYEMAQSENDDPVLWKQPSSVPKCLSSHLEIFKWIGKNKNIKPNVRLRFPWILWHLWKARNAMTFEQTCLDVTTISSKAMDDAHTWLSTNDNTIVPPPITEIWAGQFKRIRWLKPEANSVKCNISVSWDPTTGNAGTSWLVRDHSGLVICHDRRSYAYVFSALEVELLGFLSTKPFSRRHEKVTRDLGFKTLIMPEAEPSPKPEDEDRISELSDDILIHILLLVPTKDAVTTTFLSKRWRFVWRKLPRLDYRETRNMKSVWWFLDESMRFHDAPLIEKLSIRLGPECPTDVDVVRWVAKAVDRCVLRELKFKLLWKTEPVRMPSSLYTCETLTKLILADKVLVDVPCPVYLPSLHQLELLEIVYKDEDSHVRLLSGCPVLKRLKVSRQDSVDDNVRKFTVKVPSLLELTYMNTYFGEDDDDDRSLVIDTPCLIDIDIFDTLGHSCSIEYMPRLIRASVSVKLKLVDKFLKCLSSIEYLKLDPVGSTMAPWCNVVYTLLIECRIYPYISWSGSSLGVLLSNCPKLKVLLVESVSDKPKSENHDPVLWKQPNSVPKCLSSHLEIFEWIGYAGRKYQKEVIRYILENSKYLKKAEISLNSFSNLEEEQKKKMIEELESMPRVSTSLLRASPTFLDTLHTE